MKIKTILKIGFCVLLVLSLTLSVLHIRVGRNRLQMQCVDIHNSDFLEKMISDWDTYAYLADGFPMTRDEFYKEAIYAYDDFFGQRVKFTAVNKNDYDIRILGLEISEGTGRRSIYLKTIPEKTIVIPSNTTEPQNIWFPCISGGASNEEVLFEIQKNFTMKVIYVDASSGVQSLSDADEKDLHKEWVRSTVAKES